MRYLFLVLLVPIYIQGQNTIAFPDVINFSKQSFKGGIQTWDIKQDKNGIMYFANNEGLLTYNGKYWKTYPLPNKTIVRSVEISNDNKIYVGGQDEIGFFTPMANGELKYNSIAELIPSKHNKFGDIWDIVSTSNGIFFRSDYKIFKLINNNIEVYPTKTQWRFLGLCDQKLYAQELNNGLLVYDNNAWNTTNYKLPDNDPITSIIHFEKNTNIITTLKNGIYSFADGSYDLTPLNASFFNNYRIYTAEKINDNWFAAGTTNSGVFIIDKSGNIIQSFSLTEGLQNNNVLCIKTDNIGNVWLGLNNGIDLINYNSAIKLINPLFQDAAGYTALVNNDKLYLGTANDLYSFNIQNIQDLSFSKGSFTSVANTKGQSWGLAKINNKVLLGHHEGAFIIENNTARQISSTPGFWNFIPTSAIFPSPKIIGGNYTGLSVFDYSNNSFTNETPIPGFSESSRFITSDADENLWVSHPYHGLYKLVKKSDNSYKTIQYTEKDGLPSNLNNHVYKIRNEIIVGTEKGIYSYNKQKNSFAPSEFYAKILGNESIRYVREDIAGNIWFIHEKSLGVIDLSTKQPKVILIPELTNKLLSGFDLVYPINQNNIILAAEKGFYHMNYEKYKQQSNKPSVQVRYVKTQGDYDSVYFGGYFSDINEKQIQSKSNTPDIRYGWSTIHIEFSSSPFNYNSNLQYSYRLKGYDDKWSSWSEQTEKEYTNLNAGKYVFEVKVKNNLGIESDIATYTFNILPPWYASFWMKSIYFIIALTGIFYLYQWQRKKFVAQQKLHEEEQKKLRYIHELELSKNEAEMINLQNEKLESEIDFKNAELAATAMHLVQKGEILTKIKTALSQIMKVYENPHATSEIKKLLKSLGEDENIDKEWEAFSKHFDNVHKNFLTALKAKHPNITSTELKLSAYLYMNLSTKEMAQLMNISVRGVEISRYRLRKKLQIPTEVSLVDYMMSIYKKSEN